MTNRKLPGVSTTAPTEKPAHYQGQVSNDKLVPSPRKQRALLIGVVGLVPKNKKPLISGFVEKGSLINRILPMRVRGLSLDHTENLIRLYLRAAIEVPLSLGHLAVALKIIAIHTVSAIKIAKKSDWKITLCTMQYMCTRSIPLP